LKLQQPKSSTQQRLHKQHLPLLQRKSPDEQGPFAHPA
jgi:hypothetical protein